jgi:hypothetical protein
MLTGVAPTFVATADMFQSDHCPRTGPKDGIRHLDLAKSAEVVLLVAELLAK